MTKFRAREDDSAKIVTNRRLSVSSSKLKNFIYIAWFNSQSLPFIYLEYCIQVLLGQYFLVFLSEDIVSSIYTQNPVCIQRKSTITEEVRNLRAGSDFNYSGFLRERQQGMTVMGTHIE